MRTGAGSIIVQAPAAHLLALTAKSVVLSSTFERPAWQHDTGMAQREVNNAGNPQERIGLPGQQNRMLAHSDRCGPCGCGYGNGNSGGYGNSGSYGNNGGSMNYRYGYGYGYGWGNCGGDGRYPHYRYGSRQARTVVPHLVHH